MPSMTQITFLSSLAARGLPHTADLFLKYSLSSHDQQGKVRNQIKPQDKHLEQADERVDGYVERFSGDWIPSAVCSIDPIPGTRTNHKR